MTDDGRGRWRDADTEDGDDGADGALVPVDGDGDGGAGSEPAESRSVPEP